MEKYVVSELRSSKELANSGAYDGIFRVSIAKGRLSRRNIAKDRLSRRNIAPKSNSVLSREAIKRRRTMARYLHERQNKIQERVLF